MPKAYIMVGLPGSGKSTWMRKHLANVVVISSDDHIERLSKSQGLNYSQGFSRFIGTATSLMHDDFKRAQEAGKDIAIDQTNLSKKKRRSWINKLGKEYDVIAVNFSILPSTLSNRLSTREKETGKSIPEEIMKSMAASYQPVTKDEGFSEIITVRD